MSMQKTKKRSPALELFYALQRDHYRKKNNNLGKVLTIIDACIPDRQQRKGIKNLIEQTLYSGNNESESRSIKMIVYQFYKKFMSTDLQVNPDEGEFWSEFKDVPMEDFFPEEPTCTA